MASLGDFFLNTTTEKGEKKAVDAPVSAPASSITKVLTATGVILAPLGTVLVKLIEGKGFEPKPVHVVSLVIGLLGFMALLASADVMARAIATAAKSKADAMAMQRDAENLITFDAPIRATLKHGKTDPEVDILAATGGPSAHFLIRREDESLTWALAGDVRILRST